MSIDPPAVRWVPKGEHAGIYIYAPGLGGAWKRIVSDSTGVRDWTVESVPSGSQALYDYDTVATLLDDYRDTLLQHQEAIREDGDRSDAHESAKAEVLAELRDSEEYCVACADRRYEEAQADPEATVTLWHDYRFRTTEFRLHRYSDCRHELSGTIEAWVRESECSVGDYAVAPEFPFTVLGDMCQTCQDRHKATR